jgi:nucleoid-associated protein
MSVTQAIIHRLTRSSNEKSYSLSDTPLASTELANRLLSEIKPLFVRRASKRYGCFSDEAGTFKGLVVNWLGETLNLTTFSQKAIEYLAIALEEQDVESDGLWLFAVDEQEAGRLLWLVQLRQLDGFVIDPDNRPDHCEYIDFAKTGVCASLNLEQVNQPGEKKYLTVSFGFGERPMQKLMLDYLSFTDTVDTIADTERFMALVEDYSREMPEETGRRYQKEVAEYCIEQAKQGEAVSYRELSGEIESSAPTGLDRFIEARDPELKEAFIPDRTSLKRYIRYSGRSRDVSISFSNESLGKNVTFDPDSNTLTLSELPASLVRQLKGE